MKQRTLARAVTIHGTGLHTGNPVQLTFKPAPANHGLVFKRTDLHGQPEIKPKIESVGDLVRNTTVQEGHAKIHLVEHVLSALHGCGIDNVLIEMDASEPPIMDGSARPFVNLILEGEPIEQDKDRVYYTLDAPVSVMKGNRSIIALPYDGLKITCTSSDDRGYHTQHLSIEIDPETYIAQIAAARTFTIYEDIEELLKLGKIRGGSLDSAIVIKGGTILSKEPLRFKDEFVRHKILDIVGDIVLLGVPLKAHIVATCPGHQLNADITKALFDRRQLSLKPSGKKKASAEAGPIVKAHEDSLDIRRILEALPHRYPFVMIDRVTEFRGDDELTATTNVTINEPFFQGHFPNNPVMPGVLQLECMAQAAGVLMLRRATMDGKTSLFMSADRVKFRKPVRPGDRIMITAKLTKTRGDKLASAECTCMVDGMLVSSAELMFALVDEADVN
ncbi:MAG TPA: bifunctional UDP-3-O-[3-hydroxymyristoyl] N-acetylglucosamine deacetylase/3-hydroxyacyl-ACP dehydratase [Opitutaceae bacterium]|nr:bifunctional UDP-3-O-[3-hydroxymyristoyl] N-acetylglucosamine deacetylase/3-hydroxyacyl-ACP dehydratase [Opitutaceae bacterium]